MMKRIIAMFLAGVILLTSVQIPVRADEVITNLEEDEVIEEENADSIDEVIDDVIEITDEDDIIEVDDSTEEPLLGANAAQSKIHNPRSSNGVVTWDCVYFGNYWQNDTNKDGRANKDDAKEKIKWRVLSVDGNDAFLIADQNLVCQKYNNTLKADVTWKTCTLRSWLNGYDSSSNVNGSDYSDSDKNFMDTAFTSSEQGAIIQTTLVNADNPEDGTEGGDDTQDNIFLLSYDDAVNNAYGFASDYSEEDEARWAKCTAYGKAADAYTNNDGNVWWWLRSTGNYSGYKAMFVHSEGDVARRGNYDYNYIGVRPALHLNLSSSLWSYAGTVSSKGDIVEPPKPAPPQKLTFDEIRNDLFTNAPRALVTKTYTGMYYDDLVNDMSELCTEYISKKGWFASLKYTLKNVGLNDLKIIYEYISGNNWTLSDISDSVVKEYLLGLSEYDDTTKSIRKKLYKHIKNLKNVAEAVRNGENAYGENKDFNRQLSIASKTFTEEDVKNTYIYVQKSNHFESLKKAFKSVDVVITAGDVILMAFEEYTINETAINILNKYVKDNDFKNSLDKYSKPLSDRMLRNIALDFAKKELIEKKVLSVLVDNYVKEFGVWIASSYFGIDGYESSTISVALTKIMFYFFAEFMPCSDAEQIMKCQFSVQNAKQLSYAQHEERMKVVGLYDNGNTDMDKLDELMSDDEFLYNAGLVSIDAAYKQLSKLYSENKADKKRFEIFESKYEKIRPLLSYEKNIRECNLNYTTSWTNKQANGSTSKTKSISKYAVKGDDSLGVGQDDSYELVEVNFNNYEDNLMIVVPDMVDEHTVSGIGDSLFENISELERVVLPDTLTNIGNYAFLNCSNLEDINIPRHVKTIGTKAFAGCTSLERIDIPQSVTYISNDAFDKDTIIICGEENSIAEDYANSNGIIFEKREKEIENISIARLPYKLEYGVDEIIDTTGLVLDVNYMDGSSSQISDGYYVSTGERCIGLNNAIVEYNGAQTNYDFYVKKSECRYTISYLSTDNEILRDRFISTAMVGDVINLVAPQIEGYRPIISEIEVTIGINNDYILMYEYCGEQDNDTLDKIIKVSDTEYVLNLATKEKLTIPELAKTKSDGKNYKIKYDKVGKKSDSQYAAMTSKGLIPAKKAGVSHITLNKNGVEYKITVNVFNPQFKYENPKKKYFTVNTGSTVTPAYEDCKLKPTFTLDKNAIKKGLATINPETGEVTPFKKGTVKVTATVGGEEKPGYARKVTTTVRIYDPVIYTGKKNTVKVGKTIKAKVKNGVKLTTDWKSSNEAVATVDSKGTIRTISVGKVTITCVNNGKTISKEIEVIEN